MQAWQAVGPSGFSVNQIDRTNGSPSLAIGPDNKAYIAFQSSGLATVMKYTGPTGWVNVGTPGFASSYVLSLALHPLSGLPYLAFADSGYSLKTTVMSYNNTAWGTVGMPHFSTFNVQSLSLKVAASGTLYVADVAWPGDGSAPNGTVWTYNTTVGWARVGGSLGQLADRTSELHAGSLSLVLHPSSALPYVAFSDGSFSQKVSGSSLCSECSQIIPGAACGAPSCSSTPPHTHTTA